MSFMASYLAKKPAPKGKIQAGPGKNEGESAIGKPKYASGDAKEEVRGHVTEKRGPTSIAPARVPPVDSSRAPMEPHTRAGASAEHMAEEAHDGSEEDSEDARGYDDEPNEDEAMASKAVMEAQDPHTHARALRAAVRLHVSRSK